MAEKAKPMLAQDKLAFLLSLVPYLIDRDRVSVREAAAHFGMSEAQIRESVELLAVSGVPGETAAYLTDDLFDIDWDALEEDGEIVLTHSVAINRSLRFSAREAAALIAGLQYLSALPENADRAAITTLISKLTRGASGAPSRVGVEQSETDVTLELIRSAVEDGVQIEFDYVNARGSSDRRAVDPLRVESVDADWYLRGWSHDREALRTFRLDRMSNVTRSARPITHRADEFSLPDTLFQGSSDDVLVTLEVAPAALPLLADYMPQGTASTDVGGRTRTTIRVADFSGLKRLIAGLPGVATVLEPEAARKAVADWAAAGAAQYRD